MRWRGLPIAMPLVPAFGADLSGHATDHAGVGLSSGVLSMEPLGAYCNNNHRSGSDQSAIYPVDATFVL